MALLVFDVETTDMPDFKASADDQTARICEIAAVLLDPETLEQIGPDYHTLILPDGWTIAPGAHAVHGITLAMCDADGMPIAEAMAAFDELEDQATVKVGFSMRFDNKFIRGERRRLGLDDRYGVLPELDVMYAANPFTNARNVKGGKKMPTLEEAHQELLGRPLDGAHRALADVLATADVLRVLRDRFKIDLAGKVPTSDPAKAAAMKAAKPKRDPVTVDPLNPEVF